MDNKCYIWVLNNLDKYSFTEEAMEIKKITEGLVINEETINSDAVLKRVQKFYDLLVSNFYNNIIGYQNGLADCKITSAELDCYFIETSDAMVPIGYYKISRPVEAVIRIEKYLEECKDNIQSEKNKTIANWQKSINYISEKYKNIQKFNPVKTIFFGVAAIALLVISAITFMKMDIFAFMFNLDDADIVQNTITAIPILENGDERLVFVLTVILLIIMSIALIIGILCAKKFKWLNDKNKTNEVINSMVNYARDLENGIANMAEADSKYIYNAIEQGVNIKISQNSNAVLINTINKNIGKAKKFSEKNEKESVGIDIVMIISVAIAAVIFVLIYTDFVPEYFQTISMEETDIEIDDAAENETVYADKTNKDKNINKTDNTKTEDKTDDNKLNDDKTEADKAVDNKMNNDKTDVDKTNENKTDVNKTENNTKQKVSTYKAYKRDVSWYEAKGYAEMQEGHLVYINSKDEFDKVCKIADAQNIKVFWVGAKRENAESWSEARWLNGEKITYTKWYSSEPSYKDESGNQENYLMVFNVKGTWYFNDSIEDVSEYYSGKMGYIVEIEE